jgi:NAD(P)-dependent dehydrogenase (short-subunit alcohol dehydrogenase family)
MAPGMDIHFDGTVVLVTGGTRGIGKGIAEAFLDRGAEVVVCGRQTPPVLPRVRDREATFINCDVRDPEAVAKLVDGVAALHGRVDVLVNNAGGSPQLDAASSSPKLAEKIVQLNLLAPFFCAQAANRWMQSQATGGSIINIASICVLRASPGTAVYAAAKAGLASLTEALALEWGPKVRLNTLLPGLVATEDAANQYGGTEGIARIGATIPLKRMAQPSDIASACLFLASPLAAYVSGARLAVHGGGETPLFIHLAKSGTP